MTFKTTLLSTVAAFAFALPSVAQTTECAGELVDGVCVETEMETETETEVEPTTETEADISTDVEEGLADESDAMTAETEMPAARDLADASAFSGMTVSEVVGMPVESADAQDVGEIDYIVSNPGGPEAVIGLGGFLGLGEYTVALPLGAFTIDQERMVLVLDGFTEDELLAMPEIDESGLEELPGEYVFGS
jgi:hypothetical protein